MPVIQPALFVGGVNLNNRYSLEVLWKQTEGLFDGSALEPGATIATFDGPAKVRAHDMAYQPRRIVITGRIINRSGWLEKQLAIADLAEAFAGRPAIVHLGTLELECEFGPVRLVDDAYSHLPGYQTWRVEGEAVPGVYLSQYHTALGADQGLAVQDDRPDSSAVKFTSNSFTYTNPGTAPTEACVSLVGTASTTYYLKGQGLRRVPMTTDANGNASIDEMSGFIVYPGSNAIRVEDSAGALASGITAVNLYGTRPRFLGNAPTSATTQSATSNRMSEGPMLTPARTGSKTYINSAGTLSTVTDGTAAIGVPYGTYSATKAGIVFEGAGTEILKNNRFEVDAVGTTASPLSGNWSKLGAPTTWAISNTRSYAGTKSLRVISGGSGQGVLQTNTVTASVVYTAMLAVWVVSGAVNFRVSDNVSIGNQGGTQTSTTTGQWEILKVSYTQTTSTSAACTVESVASGAEFFVGMVSLKQEAFATSWIINDSTTATATRNADLCGIVPLQNELERSHDLTQAEWIKTGLTAAKSGSDNTLTLAATTDHAYQAVTPSSVPSTTRTAAARLKLGTLSGSVLLRLLDQSGNVIASTTVTTATLSASEYRTCYVTGTAASDDTGLRVQIIGSSGTGTILVRSLGLVQGSHPGVEVTTGDTAIPASTSPALDPAWAQNGYIEAYIVPGPQTPPNLVQVDLLGNTKLSGSSAILRLVRRNNATSSSHSVLFDRAHNGTTGTGGTAGRAYIETLSGTTLFDGVRHLVRLEWLNYTINGVRYMPLRIYIDGSLIASIDAAALYAASTWIDPVASVLITDGNQFATISDLELLYPELPAGAIPAA